MTSDLTKWSSADIPPVEGGNVKFKRKGGMFITKKSLIIALIVVLLLLIAAVLITKELTEKQYESTQEDVATTNSENSPIIRLTDDIIPRHYELKLKPYLDVKPLNVEPFTLFGEVIIYFTIVKPTSTVTLHYAGIFVNCTDIFKNNKSLNIKSDKYDRSLELYSVEAEESLLTGDNYSMRLVFNNSIGDEQRGFYRRRLSEKNTLVERWMGVTHLEPVYARRLLPCFDEPQFRSTFDISVQRLRNMTTLANSRVGNSYADQGDVWMWDTFERTPAMPTHKLSIIVADLSVSKLNVNNISVSIWTRQDLFKNSLNIVDITTSLLNYYYSYFTISQPIMKLDLVAVPDVISQNSGAWGLIMFSESLIFEKNDIKGEAKYAIEMSTKLAEQWFGNLVSINWWTDLWLKDGFSIYVAYKALDKVRPHYEIMSSFVIDVLQKSLDHESYQIPEEIHVLSDIRDIWSAHYPSLKGASLLYMIASISPNNSLLNGINNFLEQWSGKVATCNNFWESLSNSFEKNDVDLFKFINKWHSNGYPIVEVHYDQPSGEVIVDQKPFYLQHPPTDNSNWDIPLMYTTNETMYASENFKQIWLKSDSPLKFILHVHDSWILMNSPEQGFYRINYNDKNWELLSNELASGSDSFDENIKASLLDDSYQLAKSGRVPYTVPLNLTLNILNVAASFTSLRTIDTHLDFLRPFFHEQNNTEIFKNYIQKLFLPRLKNIILTTNLSHNLPRIYGEEVITKWTCLYDIPECTNWTMAIFKNWIQNDIELDPTLYDVVLKTGVRLGSIEDLETVLNRSLSKQKLPKERLQLLKSITSTSNSAFILQLLERTLQLKQSKKKNNFNDEEVAIIWQSLSENLDINEEVLKYVLENCHEIYKKFRSNNKILDAIFEGTTNSLTEDRQLNDLVSLNQHIVEESQAPVSSLETAINRLIVKTAWRVSKFTDFKELLESLTAM